MVLIISDLLCLCHCYNGPGGILFGGRLCMHPWSYATSLLTQHLINRLWALRHIYTLRATRQKNEVIRFWGQKAKGQGHSAHLSPECMDIIEWNLSQLLITRSTKNFWHFQGHAQRSRSQTTCSKLHFSGRAIPIHGVLSSLSVVQQVVLSDTVHNRFQILLLHIMYDHKHWTVWKNGDIMGHNGHNPHTHRVSLTDQQVWLQ